MIRKVREQINQKMSTLVNIVLAVVLNLFSIGNIPQNDAIVSSDEYTRIAKKQIYKLEDLRSHYLITKEEVTQNSLGIN